MRDFIYEVRGTNDPVDGDRVVFTNREEAEDYASNFGNAEIYMVELELNDDNGIPTKVNEFQIRGPQVDEIVSDPDIPNSCDADNPDNYDAFGNFRYPECDDNFSDIDEGCDDRRGHDPINRRERVNFEEASVDEALEGDDMTDEEFVEALYNALSTKREQDAFPEDKLDMNPPADDVPVVKCKITPLATHSEDEKPLNEDVDVEALYDEFYNTTIDKWFDCGLSYDDGFELFVAGVNGDDFWEKFKGRFYGDRDYAEIIYDEGNKYFTNKSLNEDVDNLTSIFNWEAADVKLDDLECKIPGYQEFPEVTDVAFTVKFISADGKIVLPVKFYSDSAEVLYDNIDYYDFGDDMDIKIRNNHFINLNLDKEDALEIADNVDLANYVAATINDDLSLGSDYIDTLGEAIDQEERYLENLVKTDASIKESLTEQVEHYVWDYTNFWQDYHEAEKAIYTESKSSEVTNNKLNEVLYYDTEAGWKEPDPNTVDITYCREKIGDNDIIGISAGFGVTFTTRSGDSIYVEANLEEAHLKYNEDYEVEGEGDAAVVTFKKPLDKIFDLRSIVPNDLDLNDVELDSVISRIEDDSDLSYEELVDEQTEFFAKQLSLDKNIHNRVIELLENAIYNRTNFEEDAMAVKRDFGINSDIDESLEESDDLELKNLDSMINKWFN